MFYNLNRFILVILFVINWGLSFAQQRNKPFVDTSDFVNWPFVSYPEITNDGQYVVYSITTRPAGIKKSIFQAIHNTWKIEVPNISNILFTDDSRIAIYTASNDSLCLTTLGTSITNYIGQVFYFKTFKKGDEEWLVYQLRNSGKELIFRNLKTGFQLSILNVVDYLISNNSKSLLIEKLDKNNVTHLEVFSFPNGRPRTVWAGSKVIDFVFDTAGAQLAFLVDSVKDKETKKVLLYSKGEFDTVKILVNDQLNGIDSNLRIHGFSSPGFSMDGEKVLLNLKEKEFSPLNINDPMVDVWSYEDIKLQSLQLKELKSVKTYKTAVNIQNSNIIRLQFENELLYQSTDDLGIIKRTVGDINERNWNPGYKNSYFIVSTKTGTRIEIPLTVSEIDPSGRYAICQDNKGKDIFSYAISNGKLSNITKGLPTNKYDVDYDAPGPAPVNLSFAAWVSNEDAVLMYDSYDIWKIDLRGEHPPSNLTNGYGKRNNIVFRLTGDYNLSVLNNQTVFLTAFNKKNKDAGFFLKTLGQISDPQILTMGPYVYSNTYGLKQQRARDVDIYIVARSSCSKFQNYFWTTDFKTFTPITNIYPEKDYNWITSELVAYPSVDGRILNGILYKPENFDKRKKYPVIINYYEKMSDRLNEYKIPEAIVGHINIPWFVSRDYIVFTPDIKYTVGNPGQSAYICVISAFNWLAKAPWVNATKIGIYGHSWGGYETNYIITHTNVFAAAMASAGVSNLISAYGSLALGHGFSLQGYYELSQGRMGATPWERPDLYIKNSPIFNVQKVTTPLLMMNNIKDGVVPFSQGVEFFTALRRLRKRVWMLQYDNGTHTLVGSSSALQHTVRVTQFFDHYLKDKPAPRWMTVGIQARVRGIDSGLDLDHSIKTPKYLLTNERGQKDTSFSKK